ncbi:MAG: hypothetical protein V1721_06780 [Pseudomonadota bacterium]
MLKFVPSKKWHLAIKVAPFVIAILSVKFFAHFYGLEFLSLSPLFGALISANVFLVGFLISGVLGDYKESERLPGEIACSLEVLRDEAAIVGLNHKSPVPGLLHAHANLLLSSILAWFHKKERTWDLLNKLSDLNPIFLEMEPLTQANFIVRLKQEQSNLRKMIVRIHTIRETSFNSAGYAIAEMFSAFLSIGLIFTKIDPYYESVFFVAFVSSVLIYMVFLIKDLDNPFNYYAEDSLIDNVSLAPLYALQRRMEKG